jgi:hypothetical protein
MTGTKTGKAAIGSFISRGNRARRSNRNARKYKAAKRRGRKIPSNRSIAKEEMKNG